MFSFKCIYNGIEAPVRIFRILWGINGNFFWYFSAISNEF